jgi:hypothetical protein
MAGTKRPRSESRRAAARARWSLPRMTGKIGTRGWGDPRRPREGRPAARRWQLAWRARRCASPSAPAARDTAAALAAADGGRGGRGKNERPGLVEKKKPLGTLAGDEPAEGSKCLAHGPNEDVGNDSGGGAKPATARPQDSQSMSFVDHENRAGILSSPGQGPQRRDSAIHNGKGLRDQYAMPIRDSLLKSLMSSPAICTMERSFSVARDRRQPSNRLACLP